MGRLINLPTGTRNMGPGLRTPTDWEMAAHRQHKQATEEYAEYAGWLAMALLAESRADGCQDPKRLVDLSERASILAADVGSYLDTLDIAEVRT
jgi:hypothetical protein